MKLNLFVSVLLVLAAVGCQHRKMNPKDFTRVNVVRHLPAPPTAATDTTVPAASGDAGKLAAGNDRPAATTTVPPTAGKQEPPRETPAAAERSYHIIVASYPNESPATSKAKQLQADGFADACVIHKDNRYRVSIAHFPSRQTAIDERARLSKLLGQDDIWIGRY